MKYQGSCHCGKIKFEAESEGGPAIECNCSHCSRKGYLLWFIPKQNMKLTAEADALRTYTFNRHAIQHHFCQNCGCAPFGFGVDPKTGVETAALNIRCVDNLDLASVQRFPFDGKSL